jgi:cytochrome c oxidase cbb3-type subunit 2
MADKTEWVPEYEAHPNDWAQHPRRKMLMTPLLIVLGGLFAYAIPTLIAGFFHVMFFHPPVSQEWSPLAANAVRGREIFLANGCEVCHSGYTRPQDVREGLYYLYPRVSLPGDFATSDSAPNTFGTARIGPDLSQEAGWHPDDWERAHFFDARYVDPDSVMPRFSFLSDQDIDDLTLYLQMRSGKSGLIRYSAQLYMKKLFKTAGNLPDPPASTAAAGKLTLADVALEASNAPSPPDGDYEGLGWPDPINLNYVDRGYWLMDNPLPITTANLTRGRYVFQQRCIGCHGRGGSAISRAAGFMSPTPIDFTAPTDASGETGNDTSPGDLYYRVLRGINGSAMENFGTRLRVDDIWKVVMFLKTIPNGGLDPKRLPTPDMYIQWKPNPDVLHYVSLNPADENRSFTTTGTSVDPFELEAQRNLAGLGATQTIDVPNFGPVSLKAASADIQTIYEQMLDKAWADYMARGGTPVPPAAQKESLPDLNEELR